jgi:hypothetical protein
MLRCQAPAWTIAFLRFLASMVGLVDVLHAVAQRGAPTFHELDAALLVLGSPAGALASLDACVDHCLVAFIWRSGDPDACQFRLTPRGRRFLLASSRGAQAA